uniref:Uncharacterized protein n=1 Tax=Sphaerodactylus townsendi TaxID=933632 RepID=A0ACB8FD50_9SAUR
MLEYQPPTAWNPTNLGPDDINSGGSHGVPPSPLHAPASTTRTALRIYGVFAAKQLQLKNWLRLRNAATQHRSSAELRRAEDHRIASPAPASGDVQGGVQSKVLSPARLLAITPSPVEQCCGQLHPNKDVNRRIPEGTTPGKVHVPQKFRSETRTLV